MPLKCKFRKLRIRMYEYGISQANLAERMGCSVTYIANRFSAKNPFSLNDIYFIIDILEIPKTEVLDYFPENGVAA